MKRAVNRKRLSSGGFTLIELLTTVVVLGVIAGLAGPSFYSLTVGQNVRGASFDLSGALIYARDEATKRNANVKILALDSNWNGGWQVVNASGNILQNQNAPAKVTITSNVTTSTGCATPCVVFNRAGRIVMTSATTTTTDGKSPSFKLANSNGTPGNTTRCVLFDASGRVNTTVTSC